MLKRKLRFVILFVIVGFQQIFAQNSNLHPFLDVNNISWHQFSVLETGIQKITYQFLKKMGVPVESLDPASIKIFGQGGKMLKLELSDELDMLKENHLMIIGGDDGSFDKEDYILFYGVSQNFWNDESKTFKNLYNNTSNYYLTFGNGVGKRVLEVDGNISQNGNNISYPIYTEFLEEDNFNIGSLGRRWFGTRFFENQTESYDFLISNLVEDSKIDVVARVASESNTTSSFTLSVGNQTSTELISKKSSTNIANEPLTQYNSISGVVNVQTQSNSKISAELTFSSNGDFSSIGYLDFIFVKYLKKLDGLSDDFDFTLDNDKSLHELKVENPTESTLIWEIGDEVTVHFPPQNLDDFWIEVFNDANTTYFFGKEHKSPIYSRSNQSFTKPTILDRISKNDPLDYILITNNENVTQGERLVNHRRLFKGFNAEIFTIEEIYSSFSTGGPDIAAIRNFVRYIFHNQNKKLKFLCLFGDTTFDYKNINGQSESIIPTYYSLNSFSLANSYMTDDFFVMMESGEGLLTLNDDMDLAVGRIIFSNEFESKVVVDKLIEYESQSSIDSWNNSFTLISDDVDEEWEYVIQQRLDRLGDVLYQNKPFFNVTKIHSDSFQQVASAGGDRYPDVENEIETTLTKGTLVVNYFGHGGEDGLSNEFIIDKEMATSLFHPGKFPLFITSTCEFARFDNPDRITAGELLFLNPTGGAIGLISTTRQIYVTNGINYNDIISKYLFSYGSNNYPTVAEALRLAKSEFTDVNQKRIISFLGDPALKLHIPRPNVILTHKDGISLDDLSNNDLQIRALDKVNFSGKLLNENGQYDTNFNGIVNVKVFDKELQRTTLGNDGHEKMSFKTIGNEIFHGLASVNDGQFDFEFVVPKDIDYNLGKSRFSFLAYGDNLKKSIGGYSDDFLIGEINNNIIDDNQGPDIDVFLNNRTFNSGDNTFNSPVLIVDLQDESGINKSGGIGHDIIAVLDDNQAEPIQLNSFFTTKLDDYTSGTIFYPMRDLDLGIHSLTVKAWDSHNNPSSKTIFFTVVSNNQIKIESVYNSPNPFINSTTFYITHNRPKELLDSTLKVYTIDGRLIWSDFKKLYSPLYEVEGFVWDGTTFSGEKLNFGTYLYTIELISPLSKSNDKYFGKIIIK